MYQHSKCNHGFQSTRRYIYSEKITPGRVLIDFLSKSYSTRLSQLDYAAIIREKQSLELSSTFSTGPFRADSSGIHPRRDFMSAKHRKNNDVLTNETSEKRYKKRLNLSLKSKRDWQLQKGRARIGWVMLPSPRCQDIL